MRLRGVAGLVAAGLVAAMTFAPAAGADDLADLQAKLNKAKANAKANEQAQDDIVDDLEHSDKELTKAYEALEKTQAQIPVAQAELDKANGEYEVAQREAASIAERLDDAKQEQSAIAEQITKNEADTEKARNGIAQMARDYAAGNYRMTSVELVVGASDFGDVLAEYNLSQTAIRTESEAMQAVREANAVATNMQVRLEATKETISSLQTQAQQNIVDTKTARDAASAAKSKLEKLEADQKSAAATLESRKAAEQEQQKKLAEDGDNLSDEIQKLIGLTKAERARLKKQREEQERKAREAAEKAAKEGKANGGSSGSSGSGGGSSNGGSSGGGKGSGVLKYPTAVPYITSSYGMRYHPVLHYWRLHAGTDFRAYCGTPIYAARGGTIEWAKLRYGYGNQVMINHGTVGGSNLMTSYNHLSKFAVSTGEKVKAGDLVGYAGATGTVTACHLHFEVYVNGNTVNPVTKLS
ncbi:M23 family metallopeptidase [Rarobacter incanus]|uniref:Murein DD-endopeptidase MepM/ murein hydrolase activator NlpD n=1 Tax=Rarobacter incanus TaxID=153494 RepID=A0A542SRQ3_9MICO|nr:M23 family metallopeptidase [Rarobacter incanus]TQK77283.1 murein DD-endopeptidase MepM/ murein hydrolase activator NlpD [Rarobacter incanus]